MQPYECKQFRSPLVLLIVALAVALFSGCACTVRKEFDAQGRLTALTSHRRFIIQEQVRLHVPNHYDLDFSSQPDPESIQLLKAGVEMGKAMAAKGVAP